MEEPASKSPARPSLGILLQAETAALRNDLDQATQLAAEYQRRLSSKNNDFAGLKMALEKALADLDAMQSSIGVLRAERHQFANDAMRAVALELRVQKIATERDHFCRELDEQQRRCTCDSAPAPATPSRPAKANSTAAAMPSVYSAPEHRGQSRKPREFIPLPFDGPDDPTDVSFGS